MLKPKMPQPLVVRGRIAGILLIRDDMNMRALGAYHGHAVVV